MIYNMLLWPIVFVATIHIVVNDLPFSSPRNDPPRGTNGIHEGVTNKNHCPLEGKIGKKDYDIDIIKEMSLHIQYKSQHGKNKQ